jgi:hypothetical protein
MATDERAGSGATVIRDCHGGLPKEIRVGRKRWSQNSEAKFLDALAMTCNVSTALEAAGFTPSPVYRRRRNDPAFAERWRLALEIGYDRLEARLIEAAERTMSSGIGDAGSAFPDMSVSQAIQVLETYRRTVRQGRPRTSWRRCEKPIEEVRASLARKLDAIERARGGR